MITRKFVAALGAACLLFSFAGAAIAADVAIGVVDVQSLLTNSDAAKSIQKQVQAEREKFLSELSKHEDVLRDMEKALVDGAKDLSDEQKVQKKKEFEEKFMETREIAQKGKGKIDKALVSAMSDLKDEAFKAIEFVAKDKGYNLILARQQVVASDKAIDISKESLKKLNDSISSITLKLD